MVAVPGRSSQSGRPAHRLSRSSRLMAALRPRTVRHARRHRLIRPAKRSGTGAANILPGATFASEFIPTGGAKTRGQQAREEWLEAVRRKLERANLLFLDPDNGLEPAGFHPTAAKSGKSIMISELHQLARPGRCLIVYHITLVAKAATMPR